MKERHNLVKVEWDTDDAGEEILEWYEEKEIELDLPEIVTVPEDVEEEDISDWLSDRYGFCHFGWCWYSAVEESRTPSILADTTENP